MDNIIELIMEMSLNENQKNENDYYKNGILLCGKCHTPKREFEIINGKKYEKGISCDCKKLHIEKEKEIERKIQERKHIEKLKKEGICSELFLKYIFKNDDGRNPEISKFCKKYVENWLDVLSKNMGILFYGSVGTGKTFFAYCITNALIEKEINVIGTNFPSIINKLQSSGFNEREEYMNKLMKCSLLVIDDLGSERNTKFGLEHVYNIIDSRYRSCKPIIITTNLDINDLIYCDNVDLKRIYDRILEKTIPISLYGESRRKENAEKNKYIALGILSK